MMTVILSLLQSSPKTSTIQEDAFLVVGALCGTLETAFAPYLSAFLPYLYPALKAYDDTTLCTVAIGIIGDVVRALGEQAAQYAEAFMTVLLENLRSEVLERGVKIVILGCFGDVALAVGGGFEPYLNTSMEVLGQAASVQANPLDYDTMEYVLQLREGILEAYTGIVAGLKGTPKVDLLLPHVPQLLQLIQVVLSDEEKTDSQSKLAYGLLWDIADTFKGGQIRGLLLQEWIVSEMRPRGARLLPETKKVWKHAREAVKIATAVPQ
jgi:importin subunit beta-1